MPTHLDETTKALLARLHMSFVRFSTSGFMNHSQFGDFCLEMGLANQGLVRRLFAAFDEDGCGALEPHEFVLGLRLMCDYGYRDESRRIQFAFHLLDEDRGGLVELDEAENFIISFERAAVGMACGWARCLEEMFGNGAVAAAAADVFATDEEGDKQKVKVATKRTEQFCEDFLCLGNLGDNIRDTDVTGIFRRHYDDAKMEDKDSAVELRPAKHFVLREGDNIKAMTTFKNAFRPNGVLDEGRQRENSKMVEQAVGALHGYEYEGKQLAASTARGIDKTQFKRW